MSFLSYLYISILLQCFCQVNNEMSGVPKRSIITIYQFVNEVVECRVSVMKQSVTLMK